MLAIRRREMSGGNVARNIDCFGYRCRGVHISGEGPRPFLRDTSGPRGTPLHYAEHVKDEAIDRLSSTDAAVVLRAAADAARLTARAKLHELARPGDDAGMARAIREWCNSEGKRLILSFIHEHDRDHSKIESLLDQARK